MSKLRAILILPLSMIIAWGALGGITASPDQVTRRVVNRYAVTSANDFPQRDPQDWRLLGSNDDGRSWKTLDARKGELFSERHQRRVFKVANPEGFGLYRLEIDRVRDPGAADSVQIAEIEPLGASDDDLDPCPLPEDIIAALAENAPLERASEAFDGRVETKWLDRADRNPTTRASWIQWQYASSPDLVITNVSRLLGLRNRAARNYTVRLQGVVAGPLGTNAWCFFDGTGSLDFPAGTRGDWRTGQEVLVEGKSEWFDGAVRIKEAHLRTINETAALAAVPGSPEQPLITRGAPQWVVAEGTVRFCSWVDDHWVFDLEDKGRSLSVHVLRSEKTLPPRFSGTRVRAEGVCGALLNGAGQSVAAVLWVPNLDAISPTASDVSASTERLADTIEASETTPVLTSISQIRRLTPEKLQAQPKIKVRGVVTELFGSFIQEGNAGVEVWYLAPASVTPPPFRSCVEIEGRGGWADGHGAIIRAEKVTVLGRGKLPEPERSTWSQLASGQRVGQWVEAEAVVRATDGSHLLLNSEGGQLMATIRAAPAQAVHHLVDATVRIRGVCVPATDNRGRMQGIQLIVPSLESVEIAQAPADPFSLPIRPIGSLLKVRGSGEFVHRVRVEAVLTFHEDRTYFIQDASGAAMAIAQQDVVLATAGGGWSWMFQQSDGMRQAPRESVNFRPGDHLQVTGFPEMRGYSPILTEVLVRKVSRTNTVVPVEATVEDIAKGGLEATLISLEAVVLRQQTVGEHLVLELQSGEKVFQAFLPVRGSGALDVGPGTRLRVNGVCQIEPVPYPELGWRVASFKLLVGSLRDVSVLQRPSWWTLRRALVVATILLFVLAIAAAWIGILRRKVDERTRQLREEIAQHEKTEARLAEETRRVQAQIQERTRMEAEIEKGHRQLLKASRLAGMAEVATSVLHNVGNVLNSANVLGSSIIEHVQRSKVSSVGKLAELLTAHRSNLARFVAEDGRGQNLPGYVERLSGRLSQEQEELLEKTRSLTESLQHIKEIIAMQQNYARVSGVLETVSLAEILEDALRMHNEALLRHQVEVVRDFEEVPMVTIDRHKVLQIFFNLLENAKYACEDSGRPDKRVTVSLTSNGKDVIEVGVSDNGIGIPTENLSRIFVQEFSTRKGGHGFGLHSSQITAQELGASLRAESRGTGRGATFILDIPLRPAETERGGGGK